MPPTAILHSRNASVKASHDREYQQFAKDPEALLGVGKIVQSSHSLQSNPAAIQEVRRILREHVAAQ
jgi:hypothetical protein